MVGDHGASCYRFYTDFYLLSCPAVPSGKILPSYLQDKTSLESCSYIRRLWMYKYLSLSLGHPFVWKIFTNSKFFAVKAEILFLRTLPERCSTTKQSHNSHWQQLVLKRRSEIWRRFLPQGAAEEGSSVCLTLCLAEVNKTSLGVPNRQTYNFVPESDEVTHESSWFASNETRKTAAGKGSSGQKLSC